MAASNLRPARLAEAFDTRATSRYAALQQRFTYLTPRPGADLTPHVLLDDDVARLCTGHGLARLGYSPLLSGAYDRPDRRWPDGYAPGERQLTALHEVATEHGLSAGEAVLSWMVSRAEPVIPVVLVHLKTTGMPLAVIADFTRLVAADPDGVPERLALLREHRRHVQAQLASWQRSLDVIDGKIADYAGRVRRLDGSDVGRGRV